GDHAGDPSQFGGCERSENPPRCRRPPAGLVQHPAGPARSLPAIPPPRDEGAGPAPGLRAAVPEGDHPPGDEPEPLRADPRRTPRGLLPIRPTDAAVPGLPPGSVPQDAGADLLQAGGSLPRRTARAEP